MYWKAQDISSSILLLNDNCDGTCRCNSFQSENSSCKPPVRHILFINYLGYFVTLSSPKCFEIRGDIDLCALTPLFVWYLKAFPNHNFCCARLSFENKLKELILTPKPTHSSHFNPTAQRSSCSQLLQKLSTIVCLMTFSLHDINKPL